MKYLTEQIKIVYFDLLHHYCSLCLYVQPYAVHECNADIHLYLCYANVCYSGIPTTYVCIIQMLLLRYTTYVCIIQMLLLRYTTYACFIQMLLLRYITYVCIIQTHVTHVNYLCIRRMNGVRSLSVCQILFQAGKLPTVQCQNCSTLLAAGESRFRPPLNLQGEVSPFENEIFI